MVNIDLRIEEQFERHHCPHLHTHTYEEKESINCCFKMSEQRRSTNICYVVGLILIDPNELRQKKEIRYFHMYVQKKITSPERLNGLEEK
jgi:hypothetical protein